jgi:hypothetical protein
VVFSDASKTKYVLGLELQGDDMLKFYLENVVVQKL